MHPDWSNPRTHVSPPPTQTVVPRGTRMGERLVAAGILTETQVERVLEAQRRSNRPFGDLCERLYGVSAELIEAVWCDQYRELSAHADAGEPVGDPEPHALALVSARQAWQFRLVPLSLRGELLRAVTTTHHLAAATRFVAAVLGRPSQFRIVESQVLAPLLQRHYPLGMDLRHVRLGVSGVLQTRAVREALAEAA